MVQKRLALIDGFAVIHRAYHAIPRLNAPNGQLVNAVYGFTSMLLRFVEDLKPDYLAVAFDLPQPTFRNTLYVAYQATRPHAEDDLREQFQIVHDVVDAAGIPALSMAGFEADDVIGTIAKRAVEEHQVDEVIVITGDRDMLQLVNDKVKLYMPVKGITEARLFDREGVKEYLGITPEEVIDYKALVGDSSDNYPGVPGVGPKTAIELLQKFGSLEGIYKAIGGKEKEISDKGQDVSITPKVVDKLVQGYESAKLSKALATIAQDVPVGFDLEDAKIEDFRNKKEFVGKLRELGFKSLLSRLGVNEQKENKKEKKDNGQMGLV